MYGNQAHWLLKVQWAELLGFSGIYWQKSTKSTMLHRHFSTVAQNGQTHADFRKGIWVFSEGWCSGFLVGWLVVTCLKVGAHPKKTLLLKRLVNSLAFKSVTLWPHTMSHIWINCAASKTCKNWFCAAALLLLLLLVLGQACVSWSIRGERWGCNEAGEKTDVCFFLEHWNM